MSSIKVNFPNSKGQVLQGILNLPKNPKTFALYAHCFTCGKDIPTAFHIAKEFAVNNIATLRFDFTGLGESEGNFADTNFTTNIEDILAAANYLQQEYKSPQLLLGHSLGGTAIIAAASQLPDSCAVVTIASPHKPSHVLQHFAEGRKALVTQEETTVDIMERAFTIKRQFVEDLDSYDQKPIIENLNNPILILHSPADKIVSIKEASNLFTAAAHPKSYISLDQIDHMLSDKKDAQYVAQIILAWSHKYIFE